MEDVVDCSYPASTTTSALETSRPLQTHVLIWSGKVEKRVQTDSWLFDPWSHPVQGGWFEDRCVHDALMHQPLDLMEQRLPTLAVALTRLLHEQVVEVRVSAIGIRGPADDEGLDPRRGVAQGPRGIGDEPLQLLRPPDVEKGRPLQRPHAGANARRRQRIGDGFAHGGERRERREVPGIEATGVASRGQEALGLREVIRIVLDAQRELQDARNDRSRETRVAQAFRVVDRLL